MTIDPVTTEDLIEANWKGGIDASSSAILTEELKYIEAWRPPGSRLPGQTKDTLTALALSGGGIRSATFALGVMQALGARNLMCRFDYLSTVSGGGYIGSSLTWLASSQFNKDPADAPAENGEKPAGFSFDSDRFPYGVDPPRQPTGCRATPAQNAQLTYLRQHGKYLEPGNGIDLVSGIGVVLRGFLLNLLVWLPLLTVALFALTILPFPLDLLLPSGYPRNGFGLIALIGAAAALVFVVASAVYSVWTYLKTKHSAMRYRMRRLIEEWIKVPLWVIAVCLAVAVLPPTHNALHAWLSSSGFLSILLGLLAAVRTFLKSRTSKDGSRETFSIEAPIGAALALYGVLVVSYAWAVSLFTSPAWDVACASFAWPGWSGGPASCGPSLPWAWISGLLILVALITGHFVNVNLISVHRYYRDRLMEAFLPDPPKVTTELAGVPLYSGKACDADWSKLQSFCDKENPRAPYHLLNTNLILVGSKERTWRLRGGDSFILSPRFCGSNATGWCKTENFLDGDLALSTAVAISGAAANPYAGGGVFRNRFVAVLMSLANLRLGYWVGHPRRGAIAPKSRTHFTTGWREISGRLSEKSDLLQLSDGGHFENLGIYELIRRRVRLIVACDGTADPKYSFADFISLLGRISSDFGARIKFDAKGGLDALIPCLDAGYPPETKLARQGYTTATITYSDGSVGDLIYLTTTLTKDLSLEGLGYKAAYRDFPDQTTADQFFDEAQFEAYRELGYCIASQMLEDKECWRRISERMFVTDKGPPLSSTLANYAGKQASSIKKMRRLADGHP